MRRTLDRFLAIFPPRPSIRWHYKLGTWRFFWYRYSYYLPFFHFPSHIHTKHSVFHQKEKEKKWFDMFRYQYINCRCMIDWYISTFFWLVEQETARHHGSGLLKHLVVYHHPDSQKGLRNHQPVHRTNPESSPDLQREAQMYSIAFFRSFFLSPRARVVIEV